MTGHDTAHAREVAELRAEVERLREASRLREKSLHACRKVDATLADQNAKVAAVAALADEYDRQAREEGYGGEPWSTTVSALRAALADPAADDDTEGTS